MVNFAAKNLIFIFVIAMTAIFIGVSYSTPYFLLKQNLSNQTKPFLIIQRTHHSDQTVLYVPRAREIYDGRFPPNDLNLKENLASPFPWIPPLIFASSLWIFKGDVNSAYLLMQFIFPILIFLILFYWGYLITYNKIWAWFIGLAGVFTPVVRSIPYMLRSLENFSNIFLKNFVPLVKTPLIELSLARIEDPLLTYPIYLLAIIGLYNFWNKPTSKNALLLGIISGSLFYVYFHYWVYFFVALIFIGIYFLIFFIKKHYSLRSLIILFVTVSLVSAPYWLNYINFISSPGSSDLTKRIGIEEGRWFWEYRPWIDYGFYIIFALLGYFVFYRRHDKQTAIFYWLLIGSMFIVWNFQMILGYTIHSDHWPRAIGPILFMMAIQIIYALIKNVNFRVVGIIILILGLLLISKKIVNSIWFLKPSSDILEHYSFNDKIIESWQWINTNLPKNSLIASSSFLTSLYLNIYTSARPYLPTGFLSSASTEVLEQRFLNMQKLFGVETENFNGLLNKTLCQKINCRDGHTKFNLEEAIDHLYGHYFRGYPEFQKERFKELLASYVNLRVNWKDIEADYVYYGPWEKELSGIELDKNLGLKKIFDNGSVSIYQILRYDLN